MSVERGGVTEEVTALGKRLTRQLGAEADAARGLALAPALDELEQRAAELEAENHRHREQIARLEADDRELADTLEAARVMRPGADERAEPPATPDTGFKSVVARELKRTVSPTSTTLNMPPHQHFFL